MSRCTKLGPVFYSMDLYAGKTMLRPDMPFHCYLLLSHKYSEDYITDQLLQLIMSSCDYIRFFGTDSKLWYSTFILLVKLIYPYDTDRQTGWGHLYESFDDFVSALHHDLHCRPFVPRQIYLIYDDADQYQAVLDALHEKETILHQHLKG